MSSLDEVLAQIADVDRQLSELASDAFIRRIELRDRLLELRAEVGNLRQGSDVESPPEHLLAQLGHLRRQRKHLRRQRIDVVKQGVETRIYADVDAGLGMAGVEESIERIEKVLAQRGIPTDS